MKIKIITITIFLLFTISCVSATTITVSNNSDINGSFTSIQDAIDQAQDNDLIVIHEGTYYETLVVDKPLRIESESGNPDDVVISSGNLSLPVIHVKSSNVAIKGVTVTGKEKERPVSGIFLDDVDNCQINNSKITNVVDGILAGYSSGNSIQNNVLLSNAFHGIYLINSNDNDLKANCVCNNERGVYLNYSDGNIISNNEVCNNLYYGLALLESGSNEIKNNCLFLNEFGLTLTNSHQNMIIGNNASNNRQHGFFLFQATSNNLKGNVLVGNNDSGINIFVFSSNNTLVENNISGNFNGVSIIASDNFIVNNTFSSNDNYGIFHLSTGHTNILKENAFQDNPSKNIKIELWKQVLLFIFIFLGAAAIAFIFEISWLKKGLIGLAVLLIVSLISFLIWHFPFESDLPGNNVYVENLEINTLPINETHSKVMLSMNFNYLYKEAFSHGNSRGQMIDNLPVNVHVISSRRISNNSDLDEIKEIELEDEIVLEYLGDNPYECTIILESGREYYLHIDVQMLDVWSYPRPSYGEMHFVSLGGLSERLDLRNS